MEIARLSGDPLIQDSHSMLEVLLSLQWYVELILQGRTLSLYSNSSVVYSKEEPTLHCPNTILRAGLIVIEAWFRGY